MGRILRVGTVSCSSSSSSYSCTITSNFTKPVNFSRRSGYMYNVSGWVVIVSYSFLKQGNFYKNLQAFFCFAVMSVCIYSRCNSFVWDKLVYKKCDIWSNFLSWNLPLGSNYSPDYVPWSAALYEGLNTYVVIPKRNVSEKKLRSS